VKISLRYNSPVLLVAGLAVCVCFGAWIVYGQLKETVEPKIVGHWTEPLRECPLDGVPRGYVDEAVFLWREAGYDVAVDCGPLQNAVMRVDPTVDLRDSVEDLGERHGVTKVVQTVDGEIESADTRLMPGPTREWIAHEMGHQLGFAHPDFCPSGHVMHPHRPGLKDFRGHARIDRTP
jgi:hypothetical protein